MTSPSLPRLHTFEEIAAKYGLSLRSMTDQAYGPNPKISHIFIGKTRFMTDAQLAEFLERHTRHAAPVASAKPTARRGRPRGRKTRTSPAALAA